MTTPQSGILPEGNAHALFVTLRITHNSDDSIHDLRRKCAQIPALTGHVNELDPAAGLVSVIAIGADAWNLFYPDKRPGELDQFITREQGPRKAPRTPCDILLHLRSERRDLNYELAQQIMNLIGDNVEVIEEVAGFRYLQQQDLTGFIDGTENPEGDERADVGLVGNEEPDFSGGSYIFMQRYIHDLKKWQQLDVTAQEQVIGRTKESDEELDESLKPPSAHISRVVIKEDGDELEILRHSMPYGGIDEAGLVFIAYAKTPQHANKMLDQMIFADDNAHYDHLMDYTHAVTGCHFFAPSLEFLAQK